jgi:hypothetical protein
MRTIFAQVAVPTFGPAEYTIAGALFFVLGLLSRRVLAWGYQLDEKDKEIERLRTQLSRTEEKRDEYLHKLLEAGRIGVEALPKIQRSLDGGTQ